MNNYLINSLDSILDSGLVTPFFIYIFIILISFILPKQIIFEDESFLQLDQILRYGAMFFLVGWFVGKRISNRR